MTDTTDPRTGFITHNSQTLDELEAEQAAAREAAPSAPEPSWGNVGQGQRGDINAGAFTAENLSNHAFYLANKEAILAANKRQELPGQVNHTTTPLDN